MDSFRSEFSQYKFLFKGISNEVLRQRVEISLRFYLKKANLYARKESFWRTASIVMPAFATFTSALASFFEEQYPTLDMLIPVITLLATVTAGVTAHFKFSTKKDTYRNLAESMKSELTLYQCRAEKYSREKVEDEEKVQDIFMQSIEKIIEEGYEKIRALESIGQQEREEEGEEEAS